MGSHLRELDMTLPTRRDFLGAGAAAGLLAAAGPLAHGFRQDSVFKKKIRKAMIAGPDENSFKRAKDNGFDGVQLGSWNHKPEDARKARELAEKAGVRICSLIRAWVPLDSPKPDEIDACRPYLQQQLDLIRPLVVVTLGRFAAQWLLGTTEGVTKLRGRSYPFAHGVLIPTLHPAAALRGGAEPLAQMRADFVRAKLFLSEAPA